jgi:uncharacterized protein (DUF1330 family)
MAAYIIADVEVKDAKAFEAYKQPTAASVARYGGRFVVQSSAPEVLEGQWRPTRFVVLEFPNRESARRWYDSEEYREAKALRLRVAASDMILVDGV